MERDDLPLPETPDEAMAIAVVTVVLYLNSEGEQAYSIGVKGESAKTTYLGMLDLAHAAIMDW